MVLQSHGLFLVRRIVGVSYMACFYFLSLSLKTIPLGIVYSTWAGLGLVLANAISIICFKQHFDLMTIFGVTLILVGVVVLNFFSSAH